MVNSSEERYRLGQPPVGTNSFTHKPSAVIGASPGKIGTAVAQQQLRGVLGYCDSPQLGKEAFIQFRPGLISDLGEIADESTERFLRDFMEAFATFIGHVLTSLPRNR